MSFEIPDLDTATSADIQAQLIRRIPQFTTRWTDFNASDPGITLLQLLSWLGESLAYQANAIPVETQRNILRWVLGLPVSNAPFPYAAVAAAQYDTAFLDLQAVLARIERGARPSADDLQAAVLSYLRVPYLALTLPDVEALALQTNGMIDTRQAQKPVTPPPAHVSRAYALVADEAVNLHILSDQAWTYVRPPPGNMASADGPWQATLLLQPAASPAAGTALATLLSNVRTYIAPHVLLGNAVRVLPARLTDINVTACIRCPARVQPAIVLEAALAALVAYFRPDTGGLRGSGWSYGQAPDAQEVLHLIAGIPGVQAVEQFDLSYAPTMQLPSLARLGVDSLLAALPPGQPALLYDGLPRLRCLSLSARREAP